MDPQKFYDLLFKLYAEQEQIKIGYKVIKNGEKVSKS